MSSVDWFTGNVKVIDSFKRGTPYFFLSNFYEGGLLPSVEHYYQAMKTLDGDEASWVLGAPTPGTAKRRGRKVTLREDWDNLKDNVMDVCLRVKFLDPDLQAKLLATGDAVLIEGNKHGDTYWGACNMREKTAEEKSYPRQSKFEPTGYGLFGHNNLGRLLMKLREEYR